MHWEAFRINYQFGLLHHFFSITGVIRDLSNSYPLCIHAQSVLIFMCVFAWSGEYIIVYMKEKRVNKKIQNNT